MQDHSTVIPSSPLSFAQKESYVKRNIGFVKELDARMKNDINAGRRKLFNSLSTGQVREVPMPSVAHQNQAFFRENGHHRALQHERSNPDLGNHQHRQVLNQVPEETDVIINKLVNQLNETKRQRDVLRYQTTSKVQGDPQALNRANVTITQLQQVITQNDSNARLAISKLHQQKEQLRLRNEQMTVTLQNSFKARNDKVNSEVVVGRPCKRCQELDEKLKKIEAQLRALNLKYDREVQKNETLRSQNTVFISDFQQKYRELQQQLRESNQQISILREEKRQSQSMIFKLRNSSTVPSEEYEKLRIQYENLRQTHKILETQYENLSFHNTKGVRHLNNVTNKIHEILLENEVEYEQDWPVELEKMLSDLEFKCNQYKTWLEEAQRQESITRQSLEDNYRTLEMQYVSFRNKALSDEESYRTKIEQLSQELLQKSIQNREKPVLLQANEEYLSKIDQLTHVNEQLVHQINQRDNRIKESRFALEKNSEIIVEKDRVIQEMQIYIESIQFAQRDLQQLQQILNHKDQTISQIQARLLETQQLLSQKDTVITQIETKLVQIQQILSQKDSVMSQIEAKLVQTQQILINKDTKILEKEARLNEAEEFMRTVLSPQLEQQTNSLNQILIENQTLKNENYHLKGQMQLTPILEQANKKLLGEMQIINEQYQIVVSRNRGIENELMTNSAQNNRNLQAKRLVELELEDLRKQIESKQTSESPSKIRYNQEIANLQRELTQTWEDQKRIQDQSNQRYTEDLILIERRYEQKISNLQLDFKQRLQSESKRFQYESNLIRNQLQAQFKKKLAEKQLSIASLTTSSQKYGEVLIKYNTLNIDYETLVSQSKLKEQHLQKQLIELEYVLDTTRRQAQDKIREIEEVNRQLNVQNSLTYKNLENAENYIFELLQKLKQFEQSTSTKVDTKVDVHHQIDSKVQQVLHEMIADFNQEKKQLIARYQGDLTVRQSQIQNYEIQINQQIAELNHRENVINVIAKEMKDLQQKSKSEQSNHSAEIELLSQQYRILTQQNNLSVSQLSSKNREIETLRQTINDQSRKISQSTVLQTKSKELEQRVQLINSQIMRKDEELKQFTTYIEQLRTENIRIQNELKTRIQEIIVLKARNDELQASSKTSSRVKDKSEYRQGLIRVEQELAQSRRQVTGAQSHIRQLEETINHAQQQIRKLNSYIVDLQKKSETSSKNDNQSPWKKIQYETEIDDLRIQIERLNAVSVERQQKIISLLGQIVSIQRQNEKLKTVSQQSQRMVSQKNQKQVQLVKDVQFFRGKLDEAENYIFHLEKKMQEEKPMIVQQDNSKLNEIILENQKLINSLRELQVILVERDRALVSINQQILGQRQRIDILEKERNKIKEAHNQQLLSLQNQIKILKEQRQKIRQQRQKISQQKQRITQQKQRISLQKQSINQASSLTIQNYKQTTEKMVHLQRQIKQNESSWQIQLHNKNQQKEEAQRQIHKITIKIRQLQNRLGQKQGELLQSKANIQQLQSKVLSLTNNLVQIEQNRKNEESNIETLKNKLVQQQNIVVNTQKQLNELKSKSTTTQTQITQLEQKLRQNEITLKESQEQLKVKTEESQFFKNKLSEAEQYIYRIQNQQQVQTIPVQGSQKNQKVAVLEQQITQLKEQLEKIGSSDPVVSELRQEIQKTKDSIRNLQSDRADIATKFNESQSSAEAIQSNLSKAIDQAETYNIEITRLKHEKQKIEEVLSQTKSDLANTEAELQFFKNKLIEAEDYIVYLESTRGEEANKTNVNVSSDQIARLNDQIKDLVNRNRELQIERNKLIASLSNKADELKQVSDILENYQIQLKQALAKVQFLEESKKRSDEKISDYKLQIEKISDQANFFKDKLRQAENYINYFQEEKIRQQQLRVQSSQPKDKSGQLIATILNLEGLIRNLEAEKGSILVQLENKQKQNEVGQKQIDSMKKERENLIERVTYAENLLIGNVQKIQTLQRQLRETDQKRTERSSYPPQQNSEYERLITKLRQKNTQLEDELQLSYKTIDQLKQSVNQIDKEQKPQQKTFTRSNFTQIPREDESQQQFFKHKLLEAQSYIEELEKEKAVVEKALAVSEARVGKVQTEIQHLNKELLIVASDKKVLESNILQLNTLNQNLKESLRVAVTNSTNAVAIELSEENTRLKATLLDIQAASRRQLEDITSKINQLKQTNDEYRQKIKVGEQANAKLTVEIEQSHHLLQNYKVKALTAEKEIANLQLIKQDNQELLNALAALGNLKDTTQKLESRNAELQIKFGQSETKLNNAEKTNVTLRGEIDLLKNRLLSSQRFIVDLEKQLRERQATNYDQQKVRQQLQKINELQHKNKEIQMKLILSEQKQKRYLQTIQIQQTNLNIFKESLNSAEQEIEVVRRSVNSAEQKTKEDAEIIKVLQTEINKYGKTPQQEAAFFKTKLLQAESYITNLNKQIKDLRERAHKDENLVKEVQNLNEQIEQLHEESIMSDSMKNQAEQAYEQVSGKLDQMTQNYQNKTVQVDNLKQQIEKLNIMLAAEQNKYNDEIEQLRKQINQSKKLVNQLKRENEKIEEQNDERQQKIETLEAELNSEESDKEEHYKSQFFREKLFEAEAFIKELQDQNKALKLEISDFNSQIQLLSYQISKLKERQALSLSQSMQRSKVESKQKEEIKEVEQQLTLVNLENLELKEKLEAIGDIEGKTIETGVEVNFLKEKLYEAQSYIVQLQKEIETLTTENVNKEAKIKQMEEAIVALNEQVVETESKAHQFQLVIETKRQQIAQLSQESSSRVKEEIVAKAKEEEILELNVRLALKQKELQQKHTETQQIRIVLKREKNSLDKKLLQAQSYITELERENEGLNTNVANLEDELKNLQIQIQVSTQTINNLQTEKLVVYGQLQNLKDENQQLISQSQKTKHLLQTGSQEDKQKVSVILKEKQELQSHFSQQKLKFNVELQLLKNQLQQKIRQLFQAVQTNKQLTARNIQLEARNTLLLQELKEQQISIDNISNSMTLKEQKLASIQPLIQKLEYDRKIITELEEQKNKQYTKTTEMLDEINRITDQNDKLHQKLQSLERDEEEEAALAFLELEKIKEDYEYIKQENENLQGQLNMVTQQLSQKAREVDHKNQQIAEQETKRHNLNNKIHSLQKEKQQILSKITALQCIQQQFIHFKAVVQEKQEADIELAQLQKAVYEQNINESIQKSQSSEVKDSSKNKELELSLEQAKKELENELREETNQVAKELEREIDNLKTILSQKEQETRYLQEEKVKNEETIKQLEQQNQELTTQKQQTESKLNHIEQIEQALVEADTEKLIMQQETYQLRIELKEASNSSEQYKKQKLKLENEVISLKTEVQNQVTQIQRIKEQVKAKEKTNENLQNNLRNIILEYEGRIEEYNDNIKLLNNRLGESQAKTEQLQSRIKSIIIEEQPTEINVKEREQEQNQSDQQQQQQKEQNEQKLNAELEQVRQQLLTAESQLEILNKMVEDSQQEITQLKTKIEQQERIISDQTDKIDILLTQQLKQKAQIIRQKELIEEDLDLAEKKISQKELQLQGKQEKLGSSIRKLIDITNNYQQDEAAGDPTEVLEQLESFPYLNELITSILYRLRLSSAIELQKSLKIQTLKSEIEMYKAKIQNSNNTNENAQLKKASQTLILQNQQLTAKIGELTQQYQKLQNSLPQQAHTNNQAQQSKSEEGLDRYAQLLQAIGNLHNENNQLKTQLDQLKQVGLGGEKYEELLRQCADYQIHNGQLEQQLKEITQAHQKQKEKMKEYEQQIEILLSNSQSRDLYQENQSLRQKLTQSQRLISSIKQQDSSASINTQQQFKLQFLHLCLNKVDQIENQIRKVQSEIQQLSRKQARYNLPSSSEYKAEDSHLMQRLQQLQEQLIKNAENIREHHQKSDAELYILLKDIVNDEQIPAKSKQKIEDYLAQLEQQIVREYEEHQNEVAILKEQIMRNNREGSGQFSDRSRQNLIREIENLNNAIQIYHQETMRRKRVYKRVLQGLLLDMQHLNQKYQAEECKEIAKKIEEAIERNEQQDLEFDGEDFIITGGNVNVQMLEEDLQEKQIEQPKNKDSLQMQTEENKKPFLKFLLSAQDIDKQDLKLLKRKIAELRGRQIEQNLQILKNKEKKLEEVLQLTNKETSAQQIENIMVTLANNYSRDEISQIFGSEDNDQLINKLNEALCLEQSFYRGLNSSVMMQQIEQRKRKYYETPTKLSQEVFKHLLGLLSAKKDEEFYQQVDSLFRSMYEIQDGFEVSLRKKDEIYRSHNERMNQIFNRSSSDNSEDYLAEFERGNMEQVQLQTRSERKPHRSSEGSQVEQSPQRE